MITSSSFFLCDPTQRVEAGVGTATVHKVINVLEDKIRSLKILLEGNYWKS